MIGRTPARRFRGLLALGALALGACESDPGRDDASAMLDAALDADSPAPGPRVPSVSLPTKLAVLAGPHGTLAPGQEAIGFYGTDIGISFRHGDELRVLFGDTWADAEGALIGEAFDDAQAVISLSPAPEGLPDGDAVDALVGEGAANAERPFWERPGPSLQVAVRDGVIAPFELYRNGVTEVPFGLSKAVVAGFSNGRDGAFAIFRRDAPVPCSGDLDATCDLGFSCDGGLGLCSNTSGELAAPCVIGSDRCGPFAQCEPIAAGGFCQDRGSSVYSADDEDGRLEAVVIEHEVGVADPAQPSRYATRAWRTNKFTNPATVAVADFDPERDDPADNDYRPADGSQPEREKVLIWARPHTLGTRSQGRDARLYFAYVDMPERSATADFAFEPQYFAGLEHGRPRFSRDQSDAVALDLGGEPEPSFERYDVVDRSTVSYLPALGQWVMLYGGDFAPAILRVFAGASFERIEHDPVGAIHGRFALQPWGPWSEPVSVLEAGDPNASPPAAGSEYAAGGMLHHAGCAGEPCIPGETTVSHLFTPYGFLYSPNILEPWTEVREDGDAVDVYWNVSTWNPYQVVLLRTRITR